MITHFLITDQPLHPPCPDQIAIVTNTGPTAYERVVAFEEEFRRTSTVSVVKKVVLDENWDANEMVRSGLLAELAANARGKRENWGKMGGKWGKMGDN